MNIKEAKEVDVWLKWWHNRLIKEQQTFRPALGEEFVSQIRNFLTELVKVAETIEFREDFIWALHFFHMWTSYLIGRGISTGDLPATLTAVQGLKSRKEAR